MVEMVLGVAARGDRQLRFSLLLMEHALPRGGAFSSKVAKALHTLASNGSLNQPVVTLLQFADTRPSQPMRAAV